MVTTPTPDVNTLRKDRTQALISLGKIMHKQIRDGNITNEACSKLSDGIAIIDSRLCIAEGRRIPQQGEGICPICGAPLASATVAFCGNCGTNITDYYAKVTVVCQKCGQLTSSNGQYCTLCGTRRVM